MGKDVRRIGVRGLAALPLVLAAALTGCGDDAGRADGVLVAATTTQTADFVRQVGGELVTVYDVLKPNIDAHDYDPSPADLDALARAQLVVRNGLGLEPWFEAARKSAGGDALVVTATDGVTARVTDGGTDPHAWFDPVNAQQMVRNIADGLVQVDPGHAQTYRANAGRYLGELDRLDAEIEAKTAPLTNRKIVTNHDAFGYYLDRYGFEFVGSVIPSFDSQAEMSSAALRDLVAKVKTEGVTVVFSENTLPAKAVAALAEEAGVKVVAGDDALYGDSLGPAGSAGATYVAMMRHNTDTIVLGLQ